MAMISQTWVKQVPLKNNRKMENLTPTDMILGQVLIAGSSSISRLYTELDLSHH